MYKLSRTQKAWASKKKQGLPPSALRTLVIRQKGRCALSQVKMVFDKKKGTPVQGGKGCHPLYAAVDHISPGSRIHFQLVCYALNDLKGHLPRDCFQALTPTSPWRNLMKKWRGQAQKGPNNRKAFKNLLRPDINNFKSTHLL